MNISKETCFSVTCEDRVGSCADLLNKCKSANCNLKGIWGWGMEGKGKYMLVPDDAAACQQVLSEGGYQVEETSCIRIECPEQCGALCDVTNKLAEAGINLCALEAQVCAGTTVGCYIWCQQEDMDKACQTLGC